MVDCVMSAFYYLLFVIMKFYKERKEMNLREKSSCLKYFPTESRKDKDPDIRLQGFIVHWFTKEAQYDKSKDIRMLFYKVNWRTKEALTDQDSYIKGEADIFYAMIVE